MKKTINLMLLVVVVFSLLLVLVPQNAKALTPEEELANALSEAGISKAYHSDLIAYLNSTMSSSGFDRAIASVDSVISSLYTDGHIKYLSELSADDIISIMNNVSSSARSAQLTASIKSSNGSSISASAILDLLWEDRNVGGLKIVISQSDGTFLAEASGSFSNSDNMGSEISARGAALKKALRLIKEGTVTSGYIELPTPTPVIIEGVYEVKIQEDTVTTEIVNEVAKVTVDPIAIEIQIEQAAAIKSEGSDVEIIIESSEVTASKTVEFEMPIQVVTQINEGDLDVKFVSATSEIALPTEVLQQITDESDEESSVTLTQEVKTEGTGTGFQVNDKEAIQISRIFEFGIDVTNPDGSQNAISVFDEAVKITVQLTSEEMTSINNPADIKMCYLGEDGAIEELVTEYDETTGLLTFYTSHFSQFTVLEIVTPQNVLEWWMYGLFVLIVLSIIGAIVYSKKKND